MLCKICQKNTEISSENKFESFILYKLKCGHPGFSKNYQARIEKMREKAKGAKYHVEINLITELKLLIPEIEAEGAGHVEEARSLLTELSTRNEAKLAHRKEVASLLKIAKNKSAIYGESVLLREISKDFVENGELDEDDVSELRRLTARRR